jgi:hypothetical protein
MTAGLIQLVAIGVQDIYLTGDPQVTFFKIVYRRHTNFSIDSLPQYFNTSTPANFGSEVTCNVARQGDLINRMYLLVEMPSVPKFYLPDGTPDPIKKFAWVRYLGFALIKEITFEINAKIIDRQYGEWMYLWEELSGRHMDKGSAVDRMTGNVPSMYDFSNGKDAYKLYIPLYFWFCRNPGLSLPLIALTNSELKINVKFRPLNECYRIGPTNSIYVIDDVVAFKPYDYIQQTVNGQTIYGMFINYDYLTKKLYYIKIQNQNNPMSSFLALQEPKSSTVVLDNPNYINNVPYRIYASKINALTIPFYCTPEPNTVEMIENTALPGLLSFVYAYFFADFIYLDSDERIKFARSNHEYLIEQLQYKLEPNIRSIGQKINLGFNHPAKEFIWVAQLDQLVGKNTINDLFNYTTSHLRRKDGSFVGTNLIVSGTMNMNGEERFTPRDSAYFNLIQPYQNHYRGPVTGINTYSFALNPETHQPSATFNMSKVDFQSLQLKMDNTISSINTAQLRLYMWGYNLLRIVYGLGGLAFTTYN